MILKHYKRMLAKPSHNIFGSGDLATAMRMHWDTTQSNGMNDAVTQAVRSGKIQVGVQASDFNNTVELLHKLKIHVPDHVAQRAANLGAAISSAQTPFLSTALQTCSVLKVQRAAHGEMLKAQIAAASGFKRTLGTPAAPAGIGNAVYHPEEARLLRVGGGQSNCYDEFDDGWVNYEDLLSGPDGLQCSPGGGYMPQPGPVGGGGDVINSYDAAFAWALAQASTPTQSAAVQDCQHLAGAIGVLVAALGAGWKYVTSVDPSLKIIFITGIAIGAEEIVGLCIFLVAVSSALAYFCPEIESL